MEYIKVGHIVNTFGIRGALKVESLSDFTELRFRPDQELFIKKGNNYDSVIVRSVREHKGFLLVLFKGLENINLVEKYKDCDIYIHRRYIQA
ncbi:MAG: ribosome maturation factor RimM, partial [Erysipelotrichaceae bacterium]|nr:ribosome maturation factor RimM [Erysipelotrichaceae bacterium]